MSSRDLLTSYILSNFPSVHEGLDDLIEKKTQTIIDSCNNRKFETVLSVGFSLSALGLAKRGYKVKFIEVDIDDFNDLLDDRMDVQNINVMDFKTTEKFDLVLALDQRFTRESTEDKQKDLALKLKSLCKCSIVTTLRDFKNLKFNERNFDEPLNVIFDSTELVIVEQRRWDREDRQLWQNKIFLIIDNTVKVFGGDTRRTMYFKQLAKYFYDLQIKNFSINNNTLLKPMFSRAYEHIIVIDV
jgi:hypothetical protein